MAKYGPFSTELLINNSLSLRYHIAQASIKTHIFQDLYQLVNVNTYVLKNLHYVAFLVKLIEVGESLTHSVTQSLR